ncbi:hypothetical protein KPL70_020731 [Citrus sinensis]|nr:hypothetical protein KPL70_020731 [Citrus sinensis]
MRASNMRNTLNSGERCLRSSPPGLSDDIYGSCSESAVVMAVDLTISKKSGKELSKGNDGGGNDHANGKKMVETATELGLSKESEEEMKFGIIVTDAKQKRSHIGLHDNSGPAIGINFQLMEITSSLKKWTSGETYNSGPPRLMSILSWNCRGLGHPPTVQVLIEMVENKKLHFVFLMETLSCMSKLESLKSNMGFNGLFVVDRVGRSGGLALFWNSDHQVKLLRYGRNFIDVEVEAVDNSRWRLTGYYCFPEFSRRRESWDLLRVLATSSSLAWVCLGDFNDILTANEKRDRRDHPN